MTEVVAFGTNGEGPSVAAGEDLPAAAVMVLPPYFFKPVTPAGLLDFYGPVVRATRHPVLV